MAGQSDSSFVVRAKTVFQSPGMMEDFPARGGSVSASNSKTVDNSSMVGSEAITAAVNKSNVSSKIGERGEIFTVRLEAITVEVGTTSISTGIKIGERFQMRYSFQELNSNFHCPRVSPVNVGQVGSLERASNNPVTGTPNLAEGNLGVAKNPDIDLGPA